nr:hypothetical protein GCM10020063_040520 [Dactylosporangium thailandense]
MYVDVLRAVADPIRLRVVQTLADGRPHAKCSAEWGVGVHKPTMTHHFRLLRQAGLTRTAQLEVRFRSASSPP